MVCGITTLHLIKVKKKIKKKKEERKPQIESLNFILI